MPRNSRVAPDVAPRTSPLAVATVRLPVARLVLVVAPLPREVQASVSTATSTTPSKASDSRRTFFPDIVTLLVAPGDAFRPQCDAAAAEESYNGQISVRTGVRPSGRGAPPPGITA